MINQNLQATKIMTIHNSMAGKVELKANFYDQSNMVTE